MESIRYTEKQFKILSKIKKKTIDVCSVCKGEGFVLQKINQNASKQTECECRQVFRWCSALIVANIPKTYWNLDIEQLKISQVIKNAVIEYMNNFDTAVDAGLGFIFSGAWGIGKTSLMCEIGKYALLQGLSVFYCLTDDYVRGIIDPSVLNTSKPIDSYDMLLLDELDKIYIKQGSDYGPKQSEKLLRNSLPFGKVLHIGTNANEEEVMALFGKSMLSVVKRHLQYLEYEGEDYSEELQDRWFQRLRAGKINYVTGNILKYAKIFCNKFPER